MYTGIGLLSGVIGASVSSAVTTNTALPWLAIMLIAIAPTIIGAILDLLKFWFVKMGWIDKTTADKTVDAIKDETKDLADDYLDDGKINGSNKKKEGKDDGTDGKGKA